MNITKLTTKKHINTQDTGSTVQKNKPLYKKKDAPTRSHTMEEQTTSSKAASNLLMLVRTHRKNWRG